MVPSSCAVLRRVGEGATDAYQEEEVQLEDGDVVSLKVQADENNYVEEERIIENPPIGRTFAKLELERFSKDYFQSLLKSPIQRHEVLASAMQQSHAPPPASSYPILDEPDLRVPVGDNFVHLAQ
jgi:hypothetical protein